MEFNLLLYALWPHKQRSPGDRLELTRVVLLSHRNRPFSGLEGKNHGTHGTKVPMVLYVL